MPRTPAVIIENLCARRSASIICLFLLLSAPVYSQNPSNQDVGQHAIANLISSCCTDCHSGEKPAGEFSVESLDKNGPDIESPKNDDWERILRRLRAGQMPPPDPEQANDSAQPGNTGRPSDRELVDATQAIEAMLHEASQRHPFAGRTETLRRLTRTEYQNAIRDLLDLEIDANAMLPRDESSQGFDNITVGELSPTLLNRYLTAAQTISRIALGRQGIGPIGLNVRVPADRTQEEHVDGLPLGTRGGVLVDYTFPRDGVYEFQLRLTRDRDEIVEGLHRKHEIDVLIDRKPMHRFAVEPPPNPQDFTQVDAHLRERIQVSAGKHSVGVAFVQSGASLLEIKRQPFDAAYNRHRHPRVNPALFELSIVGPLVTDKPGDSASRRVILGSDADIMDNGKTIEVANRILARIARKAFRRPVTSEDLESSLQFFKDSNRDGDFDAGLETAIASILVNPNFLFRIEEQPITVKLGTPVPISDIELASRLSFFLWSSIPDERLLQLAEMNQLHQPNVLAEEVQRMLASPRAKTLVTNFAAQWLYLRNLDSITPDLRLYPDFDDNLRQAFRGETEMLMEDVVVNDRSVLGLIQSDYTFLNQRLAKHYGIPNVLGSHFRKVPLSSESVRGGILRHGSILTVTSYATRTSPTIRGNWILENILGTPPPPPPPNVPALKDKQEMHGKTLKERLAMHRADTACASCHNLTDPVGFSLDNYDALGRWRNFDDGEPLDTQGVLPDGSAVHNAATLEASILKRPKVFVGTMTEKLITYALGRGVEHRDGPEIRKIVDYAAERDFRFSAMVQGIVLSKPFLMRDAE